MIDGNVDGLKNLLNACECNETPPVVVFVSSLAAVGPSKFGRPHVETDVCRPISNYGISKSQAESLARTYCSRIPISIVRPPIVLGPGDREGLMLFKLIDSQGVHVIPSWRDYEYSVIHVNDLVKALTAVTSSGKRLAPDAVANGIYFAADDEILTYRELGRMIARALGRKKVRILSMPEFAVWSLATANSLLGRLTGRPNFLGRDKAREATAGSWTCSNAKIKKEVNFDWASSLSDQLEQTAQWYRSHGWLKPKSPALGSRSQNTDPEVLTGK
jgi:nucleoside-diphosphate-sugar epimerase